MIGELAEVAGVSRDTLRHYERKRVLSRPIRSSNGYRLYSADLVERVKMVRCALAVGFTLDEIAKIFAERECGNVPCRDVYALALTKLENVKERICEMEVLRGELENLVVEWYGKLEGVSETEPVHLLKTLANSSNNALKNRKRPPSENLRRKNKKGKK